MDAQIRYGNILVVDGKFLQVNQLDSLRVVLFTKHGLVSDAIYSMYISQLEREDIAEVRPPSIWLMRIAKSVGEVILPEAIEADSTSQENRGVFKSVKQINYEYRYHWYSVAGAGFEPEIREANSPKNMRGACLLATLSGIYIPKD